jgi:hypothetical protein
MAPQHLWPEIRRPSLYLFEEQKDGKLLMTHIGHDAQRFYEAKPGQRLFESPKMSLYNENGELDKQAMCKVGGSSSLGCCSNTQTQI